MGARHGADDVERAVDVRHPVAHRFVQGILERLGAGFDRHDRGPQQLHPEDVGRLPLDILAAHVDNALHAVAGADGGGCDPVLAGAGFGNDALLAHAPREQCLAKAVVDLVRAGVVEIFALEPDLRAAKLVGPAPGMVDRGRAPDEVLELVMKLGEEFGIVAIPVVGQAQFIDRLHQGFSDEDTAKLAEMPRGVGKVVGFQGRAPERSDFTSLWAPSDARRRSRLRHPTRRKWRAKAPHRREFPR